MFCKKGLGFCMGVLLKSMCRRGEWKLLRGCWKKEDYRGNRLRINLGIGCRGILVWRLRRGLGFRRMDFDGSIMRRYKSDFKIILSMKPLERRILEFLIT